MLLLSRLLVLGEGSSEAAEGGEVGSAIGPTEAEADADGPPCVINSAQKLKSKGYY